MILYINIIRTSNFSARLIHLGEWLWQLKKGMKISKSYNHVEIGYSIHGVRYTSGSRSDGTKTILWDEYIHEYKDRILSIEQYEMELTEKQWRNVKLYLDSVECTKYEHLMFLWYTLKLIFGVWFGSRNSKRLFCLEHGVKTVNASMIFHRINLHMWPCEFRVFLKNKLSMSIINFKGKIMKQKGNDAVEPVGKPPTK